MEISKRYALPFAVTTVYDAWVSSATVIAPATRMDLKAEPGGHYRLFIEEGAMQGSCAGTFLEVEPPTHLNYSWEWNGSGEMSTIDVRFQATATGTVIELLHSGLQSADSVAAHDSGWDSYLQGFAAHLAGQ